MFCHCLLYAFSLLILLLLFHNLFCRIVLLVKQIDHFDRKKNVLFCTTLSFCSIWAQDLPCEMSGKFVQCWCSNWLLSKNKLVQNKIC